MSEWSFPLVSVVERPGPRAMNAAQALVEARRCLFCFEAPCSQACPVRIDIPGFIKRMAEENLAGSCQLLVDANPLAAVCGLVCPTEDLCEGACVLSGLGQQPIRIGALQHFVAMHGDAPERAAEHPSGARVAVIGGGPSGIGCAVALRRLGHQVDLYERGQVLGGLASQVIPAPRLPQEVVDRDLSRLQRIGIAFRLKEDITPTLVNKLVDQYDACFLGIGLRSSTGLALSGLDRSGVVSALDFLEDARRYMRDEAAKPAVGENVVVIGGGNVAVDAAVMAKHLGAERVIVLYRRTLEEMPAWRHAYLEAASQGVEFRWLSTVAALRGEGEALGLLEVQPMRRTAPQADGRRGVEPDPEAPTYELRCDMLLLALGQALQRELADALGLPVAADAVIAVGPDTFQTAHPKVFAAGDAVSGGSTVVASLAQGMSAGRAIHGWLSGQKGAK